VAENIATLDHMLQGRLGVGLVRGYQARWVENFKIRPDLAAVGEWNKDSDVDRYNRDYFAEFVEIVVLSGVTTAIFLGGHHLPFGERWLLSQPLFAENGWLTGALLGTVFWLKVLFLCWVQLAIRWTFPRFRYDQIQTLGWKILLPVGLLNVFVSGALILWDPSLRALAAVGLIEIFIVVALTLSGRRAPEGEAAPAAAHGASAAHPH
jgi:NADH-quinone oxidoreductase subunit H